MTVKIEKNIYVRDKYKVKRQAFTAGQEVDVNEYNAVLATNAVVNPEDLPVVPKVNKRSLAVDTKDLAIEPTETVVRSEDAVKEVEAEVETKKTPEEGSVAPTEVVVTKPKKTVKKATTKPKDE